MKTYLLISGLPMKTASVRASISGIRRYLKSDVDYVAHTWLSKGYKKSFFKHNGRFVWFLYQITKVYKPARITIDRIYFYFKEKFKSEYNEFDAYDYLGLGDNLIIEDYKSIIFDNLFCELNTHNYKDLKQRARKKGSSNLLGFNNMKKMFEGINRALNNLKNIQDDDVIIRLRPDLVLDDIDIIKYVTHIKSNDYDIICFCQLGSSKFYGVCRISDQFFICKAVTLRNVLKELGSLNKVYEQSKAFGAEGFGGEVILSVISTNLNLKVLTVEGIKKIER